jgi:hypothetical protein
MNNELNNVRVVVGNYIIGISQYGHIDINDILTKDVIFDGSLETLIRRIQK